jgi:hypothetical protein
LSTYMVPKMTPAIEVLAPLATTEGPLPPIIAGTSWEEVLTAYPNAAVDSPNTVRAYRRHCTMACQRMGIRSLAELNGAMLAAYRQRSLVIPGWVQPPRRWLSMRCGPSSSGPAAWAPTA